MTLRTMKLHQKYRRQCSHCAMSYRASTMHQNPSAKTADFSCSSASVFGSHVLLLQALKLKNLFAERQTDEERDRKTKANI